MLIDMPFPAFPVAQGVLYCDPATSFDEAMAEQEVRATNGKVADFNALLLKGQHWEVSARGGGES